MNVKQGSLWLSQWDIDRVSRISTQIQEIVFFESERMPLGFVPKPEQLFVVRGNRIYSNKAHPGLSIDQLRYVWSEYFNPDMVVVLDENKAYVFI